MELLWTNMLSETDRTCPSTLTVVDTTTWREARGDVRRSEGWRNKKMRRHKRKEEGKGKEERGITTLGFQRSLQGVKSVKL